MSNPPGDVQTLAAAFKELIRTTQKMEEAYRRLEERVGQLDLELATKNRELALMREQVRQKDRLAAVGEMAATVAHEIRNPLGGIRGFAALLARDLDAADPRQRLVKKIVVGTQELDRVVTELLEYTRPLQLRLAPASCGAVIENALSYVQFESPIKITKVIEPTALVLADEERLRQVLLNILLNAAQSLNGTGEIRITVQANGKFVTIAIADTGRGIDREQLDKVFSPFFTTKEKGTGLGLAAAAKIVDAHGGRLEATSEPGKGATFLIHLLRAE
ncbi:MAG: hypothetical protein HY706_09240 [Candidatus Hydrogenedentes bacterium]|nr:hypothetical protein [Candidatus Hydrogenedentota bacterium]